MNAIPQNPALTLFIPNRTFQVVPPSDVYIGTKPSFLSEQTIEYVHPVDFGVHFRCADGGWSASLSGAIRHLHADLKRLSSDFRSADLFQEREHPTKDFLMEAGFHVFAVGTENEGFQAFLPGLCAPEGPGWVRFSTEAQKARDTLESLIKGRIQGLRFPGDAVEANVAVLTEDLSSLLSRPKTPRGACQAMGREFEACFDRESGRLIALLAQPLLEEIAWPSSVRDHCFLKGFHFDAVTHTLYNPMALDSGEARFSPLPKNIEKAITAFNARFSGA